MRIEIFDYGMNGEGVGKIDGKITLVNDALVGETVEAEITQSNKNFNLAELKKVLIESNQRVIPPCPYFYSCGGCSLQHFAYAEQLKFKTLLVKKTLKKIANLDVEVENCVASDNVFNYRNKCSFVVGEQIGFYKKNSKQIVDVENCLIASQNINKVLLLFKQYITTQSFKNDIKNLVVRDINNQLLVGVVAKKFLKIDNFYTILQQNFKNIGLFLIKNTRNDAVVLTNNITHLGGIKSIKIENFGLTYFVDLLGFHQTNINIQNKIYSYVLELIGKNKNIINGFSGSGLLSAALAKNAKSVVGIEIEPASHQTSEKLKADNKIDNLKNVLGNFNVEFKKFKSAADVLVVDPAKKGLDNSVLQQMVGVKQIIYISCNPIALAKDLRYLKNNYIIEKIATFDMFPNTSSVETVVKLKLIGD